MTGPTAELRDLARQLFAYETRANGNPVDVADAMGAVGERLYVRLERLIAVAGFHALLRRAVRLAQEDYAWLAEVRVEEQPRCSLIGLREAADGRDQSETSEAFVAVVANVLWLLVIFIGEDLTLSLVLQTWPALRDEPLDTKDQGYE